MSEIIKERLKESMGKDLKVFLNNGFKYEGKLTNTDNSYIEILERDGYKILKIKDISDLKILTENNSQNPKTPVLPKSITETEKEV